VEPAAVLAHARRGVSRGGGLARARAGRDELRERILELYARYPQYPPYGGEFPDPVPHATVGQPADVAEAVRAAAEPLLPVEFEVGAATLMEEVAPERWRAGPSFPFEGLG
jgi:fermentation-respiration switch protein FrsA (DUF1100 family)